MWHRWSITKQRLSHAHTKCFLETSSNCLTNAKTPENIKYTVKRRKTKSPRNTQSAGYGGLKRWVNEHLDERNKIYLWFVGRANMKTTPMQLGQHVFLSPQLFRDCPNASKLFSLTSELRSLSKIEIEVLILTGGVSTSRLFHLTKHHTKIDSKASL